MFWVYFKVVPPNNFNFVFVGGVHLFGLVWFGLLSIPS